jgi:crotonobetainyl-CoA:carnitine CoA-transferase CaiB-like acyl-CoA transferase
VPGGGVTKLPKIPLRMDHAPFDLRLNPPRIGEGSLGLYQACGFSGADIRALIQEGIVRYPGRMVGCRLNRRTGPHVTFANS